MLNSLFIIVCLMKYKHIKTFNIILNNILKRIKTLKNKYQAFMDTNPSL